MKTNTLSRAGVALVTCAAAASILISQGAFAQGEGAESGFAALIGRERIRTDDARFQPAAALVMHEATELTAGPGKGKTVVSQTVLRDFFDRYVINIPSGAARGGGPRPLTASEAAFLEELFTHDLSKARGAEITKNGFSGGIKPSDVDIKPADLMAKARARAVVMSKWFGDAAQGLGPIK